MKKYVLTVSVYGIETTSEPDSLEGVLEAAKAFLKFGALEITISKVE